MAVRPKYDPTPIADLARWILLVKGGPYAEVDVDDWGKREHSYRLRVSES